MRHVNPDMGIMTNYGLLAMELIPPRKQFRAVGVKEREGKREGRGKNKSTQNIELIEREDSVHSAACLKMASKWSTVG